MSYEAVMKRFRFFKCFVYSEPLGASGSSPREGVSTLCILNELHVIGIAEIMITSGG